MLVTHENMQTWSCLIDASVQYAKIPAKSSKPSPRFLAHFPSGDPAFNNLNNMLRPRLPTALVELNKILPNDQTYNSIDTNTIFRNNYWKEGLIGGEELAAVEGLDVVEGMVAGRRTDWGGGRTDRGRRTGRGRKSDWPQRKD